MSTLTEQREREAKVAAAKKAEPKKPTTTKEK